MCCCARKVVLSHTPFRPLAERLGSRPVLVSGRNETPAVAAAYGYQDMVTSLQLGSAYPHAVPFSLSAQGEPGCLAECWHRQCKG